MKKNKRIKKWGFLVSLFILFLVSPLRVCAEDKLAIVGDSSISPGGTVSYTLELEADSMIIEEGEIAKVITGFSSPITYESSVLTLSKIELGEGWTGTTGSVATGQKIEFTNENGVIDKTVIATLVFKVNSSVTTNSSYITLSGATYSYKDENDGSLTTSLNSITKSLTVKSSDNSLSGILVNKVSVDSFNKDVYEYDVTVESAVGKAVVSATTTSSKATIKSGLGEIVLNYGSNVINIVVVSESGVERTYTVNITREDTRSTDTTLSSISVDGVPIEEFKSNKYKYTVKKYKAESVNIVGVANDKKAIVNVTSPSNLVAGENNYIITVTSENGNYATYTVVINNIGTNINKKLKTLSIKGYNIDFDKNNNRYVINYNKEKFEDLRIYYTTVSGEDEVVATISPDINNDREALKNLKAGDIITITVSGIDGESTEYTIVIEKDNRVSFFLIMELFAMLIIVIIIVVIIFKKKNIKNSKNKKVITTGKKDVKEAVKEKKEVSSEKRTITKPKKKKFSIFEDEDEDDEFSTTKELTDEELRLK